MLSLSLGPFAIPVAQALMLAALLVALLIGKLAARRRSLPITDVLFNMALVGAVSARTIFMIRYFGEYRDNPVDIIDIRDGGFDAVSGLIGMAFYASFVVWRRPALRRPLGAAIFAGALT